MRMFRFNTIKSSLLWVCVFLIVVSCSMKTLYGNLDYLIPAYIDNLVELDQLEELADRETLSLLIWHQKQQLPKYAHWLSDIKNEFNSDKISGIKSERIQAYINRSSLFWHDLRSQLSLKLAEVLPLLQEAQVQELFSSLEENNRDFITKNLGLDKQEQEELYRQRLIDNFEDWFGYLTAEQKTVLSTAASKFTSLSQSRLKARLDWQQQTKKLLYSEVSDKKQALLKLFNRLSLKHDHLYKNTNDANRRLLSDLISQVIKTLQPEQVQHLNTKLDDYILLIDSLMKHKWK